jgi:hypothetical protein
MKIYFDFELEDQPTNFSITGQRLLEEIRDYIARQLQPIQEELEKEEKERRAAIIVGILNRTFGMYYFQYSPDMIAKIKNCFSDQSRQELNTRLAVAVQVINN